MSTFLKTLKSSVIAAALVLPAGYAIGQSTPSSQQIIEALKPKPPIARTRSLSASPPASAEQAKNAETEKFVDSLRNRPSRSLSTGERQQIAAVAETKPRIDLEIKFDYNSANIAKAALPDMDNLGKALTDPALKSSTFVLAGHTDGVGGEEYNQDLSSRRADSVKNYLVQKYKLEPGQLVTAGFGKTRLKVKEDPKAAANRRVEVVNMLEK
ncbi:MAG: OmpA family protein [Hyphomicrobiales bacterium]|nr:OmpA family protein [Alphaproteobacteria bacterium]